MSVDQPAFALDLTALTSPGFDWPMSELDAYDYTLPPELIAQFPLRQRTDARLLVVDRRRRTIDHFHVRDLPELLSSKDVLVLNDTKVVEPAPEAAGPGCFFVIPKPACGKFWERRGESWNRASR